MFNPISTYRIQFNKDFTFNDFRKNIEYFFLLGPSSIYASPVFEASPGSMHGYDVTNPLRINPEIGRHSDFINITGRLWSAGIGWVQDIVPNHMAFHMNNPWLMDVLEKGRKSPFASFFDIDFSHPEFNGKIMVPFLGKHPDEALKAGEITAGWLNGNFVFRYFDYWFPFSFESFRTLMIMYSAEMPAPWADILGDYSSTRLPEGFLEKEWSDIKSGGDKLYGRSAPFRAFIDNISETINGDPKLAGDLLDDQNYRLAYWMDSMDLMNYRRFFTVNSLICLRMENDEVFEKYHELIAAEVKEHRFTGLRIDHIDGLQRPVKYLEKLRLLAGEDTYIVAEKILGLQEDLPSLMQLQGTSGYDYLGIVNNLFTNRDNYPALEEFYRELTGITDDVEELIYKRKKLILTGSMAGEWENLARMFDESGFVKYGAGLTPESIKEAIGEFLILFPVYKLYSEYFPLTPEESSLISTVFDKAVKRNPSLKKPLGALQNVFSGQKWQDEDKAEKVRRFWLRCMQFTGPLMAKGVEDTVMYYYNCFIGHNEVGDHPGSPGITAAEYHALMIKRQKYWPMSMNGTSTHDTKRGEDVRARLNVITEMPGEWMQSVRTWIKLNKKMKTTVKGRPAPDVNEEYFIYQTLAGALPFNRKAYEEFLNRMDEYLVKSLREGKTNSNWNEPDEEWESAVTGFTRKILDSRHGFLKSFIPFQEKISGYGIINSLSQLLLKGTSPGIPDFYQGSELWDLSLVDPDNRRPVDYAERAKLLKDIRQKQEKNTGELFHELYMNRNDGRIKLWLTSQLLKERRSDPDLFLRGRYLPLKAEGRYKDHIIAFARIYDDSWIITVVPLFLCLLEAGIDSQPEKIDWKDTALVLPDTAPLRWESPFFNDEEFFRESILITELMKYPCPVYLKGKKQTSGRHAGVLAHISSLPGRYGTGDLGEEAYRFADLLAGNGQSFWQILPFNPVGEGYAFSPYSSVSAFAGNIMFISPELLVRSGLLPDASSRMTKFRESNRTDFKRAIDFRNMISDEVFTNFFCRDNPYRQAEYDRFCERESYWLHDFALFNILKREFDNVAWNEWPEKLRNRNRKSLEEYISKFGSEIKKEMFLQYLFQKQWTDLKNYCNTLGIRIIGDMSFYVNYDSAEVWSHPEYFKLDAKKRPKLVAGVPPDFFSETGQLWNMPVYDWDRMKKNGYEWWINRIKRNIELCDLVRFDHFRGFSAYWEVPFGESTAVNGKWTKGPGDDFFEKVRSEFPDMPFIAEDLGSIDEPVYRLRDDFNLPGMVVLQFAFGDNTPGSGYITHNHTMNSVVYTGTHDNNTTKGWYLKELSDRNRKEAEELAGHKINDENCHEEFIRMAYSSVARIAIIPVQDLLGLDERARLNKPSTSEKNWDWKMRTGDMEKMFSEKIRRMGVIYGRI